MSIAISLIVGVIVILLITALTGYFVAQEFAYMAVDRARLTSEASSGDTQAERALGITRRTSFMLSGAQLGITVTGLLVGYVAEPLIGQALGTLLGGVGIPASVSIGVGAVIALLFSTVVQMVFGELFPKNLAIANPLPVAKWLATSTAIYLKVFGWLIIVFDKAAEALLKVLGIKPVHDVEHAATAQDLRSVVEESRESGDLSEGLSTMLDRVLDFPERDAEHAMIPRSRVDVLRVGTTVAQARQTMSHGHSRYPVLDNEDRIVGVLNLLDILALPHDCLDPVEKHTKDALVVAETMGLTTVLDELRHQHHQLACVVDEYGWFTGVVTFEDLAEEIVGEITDEHDPTTDDPLTTPQEGVWEVDGTTHVDEVERSLGVDLPETDQETIGGMLIDALDALPDVGDSVTLRCPIDPADLVHDDPPVPILYAEVIEVEHYVPTRIRIRVETVPQSSLGDEKAGEE
ncbi:hemolysin family protein [Blastococcus sp. Marseille-P5729]|uniref:hemolysin family protein n=1 Tax=Blastococcus sp. Marseille-P5729 TaxID=2086582 RepID=UPI000D0EB474|nr:hemolysin family protein [Blastococcus sp. Marseille-P5729]